MTPHCVRGSRWLAGSIHGGHPLLTHTPSLMARCCLALCLGWAPTAWAADLVVTTLSDAEDATDGVCALREAITAANSDADFHECVGSGGFGADTITFSVSGTIMLGSALPNITDTETLTIDGGSVITISGNTSVQVMVVAPGASLTLRHLTVADGNALVGGGVLNFGTLVAAHCTFSGNTAADGGGINNIAGTLEVTHCTFSGNRGTNNGGALHNTTGATLTVTNSTFSENSAGGGGGGIQNFDTGSTVAVTNSTFSGNSAGLGGGIANTDVATVTLRNTIVANSPVGGNCVNAGSLIDSGFNIDDDGTCISDPTSQTTDPLLDPAGLQENGGPTRTIALCTGVEEPTVGCTGVSPAIDGILVAACTDAEGNPVLTDQRGGARPQGAACDLGAVEMTVVAVTTLCATLGDDRPPSLLDQDIFHFTGMKGETVTLTLEDVPSPDNTGVRATLLLLADIPRVLFVRLDSSALPNTLPATLPATGQYLVTVAEHLNIPRGSAFRGDYCVTLESSGEAWESFAPTEWVEGLLD